MITYLLVSFWFNFYGIEIGSKMNEAMMIFSIFETIYEIFSIIFWWSEIKRSVKNLFKGVEK